MNWTTGTTPISIPRLPPHPNRPDLTGNTTVRANANTTNEGSVASAPNSVAAAQILPGGSGSKAVELT